MMRKIGVGLLSQESAETNRLARVKELLEDYEDFYDEYEDDEDKIGPRLETAAWDAWNTLTSDEREALTKAHEHGPLPDGDWPNVIARNNLEYFKLIERVVIRGEFGDYAVNWLGHEIYDVARLILSKDD